jgi:DNA-binding transcriptional regulator/RsmH inhibitor MraZ
MSRRLERIEPRELSFAEVDDYGEKTCRICLGAEYYNAFAGLSREIRVTRGPEGCLVLVASEIWQEYLATIGKYAARLGCELLVLELEREFGHERLGARGRVRIPRNLAQEAGLKDKVKVFHVGGVIELWDPEMYRQHRKEAYAAFRDRRFSATGNKRKPAETPPAEACKP